MQRLATTAGARRALVLLPGAQMHPADVERAGLPQALADCGALLDLYVPDLHIDPTGRIDAVQRLKDEVVAPLHGRYAELWLGGISLGGQLALLHAQRAPQGLHGLCLLSPYPGSRLTSNAIARAGGLDAWQPTPEQQRDVEFELWQGLRRGCPDLPAFVGFGRADRFASAMDALARRLPQASVVQVPHGHDWAAWLPLWRSFLEWLGAARQEG